MNAEENADKRNLLTSWVNSYGNELYSRAFYKTSNREVAEDIVQDTFVSAYKAIARFKSGSNPKTWLYTILNNKIIDYYRSRASKQYITESELLAGKESDQYFNDSDSWATEPRTDWNDETHLLDQTEFLEVLKRCLDALPEKWRTVTIAKFFDYKKGETISKELNISPSNLWQIVHRSKLKLKHCIDKNWNPEL